MYILVYFEKRNPLYAEKAAIFFDEKTYNDSIPSLEKSCYDNGFDYMTESIVHDIEEVKDFLKD